jgi:flagellar P-ring protein precursor FlgI
MAKKSLERKRAKITGECSMRKTVYSTTGKGKNGFFLKGAAKTLLLLACLTLLPQTAGAARLKDLASIKGVRTNQLVGYGIVVGLNGTGDGNSAAFTSQGLTNILNNMGIRIDTEAIKVKNVASVMVTARLPAFAKAGQNIDVTISSVGDASSLLGGTLLTTPLKGLDNQVYAIAQGPLSTGGLVESTAPGRAKNHLTVARIPAGASVEREVPVTFANRETITISLDSPDFTTISLVKTAIDTFLDGPYATARDGATVDITVPENYRRQEIALLAAIENLEINPEQTAKVVLDERTGTVVMGENVRIGRLALSHGNLSLQILPGQPQLADSTRPGQKMVSLQPGATMDEVVRALNSVGVTPRELIAIFQSIKASGGLQAELEII